jgi:hypothetical protein
MLFVPYRRLTLSTAKPLVEATNAIISLVDGPPDLWVLRAEDVPGYRLRGTIERGHVRLTVLPKRWRQNLYLPVATGRLITVGNETALDLAIRPKLPELAFLLIWSAGVFYLGGSVAFTAGAVLVYHVVGSLIGFNPEADRIASLLRWKLGIGGSTIPR